MAGRLLNDPDADGWERSDFPIVCETCLGPNPYVRMQKIEFGGQCHISGRPYTVFRWKPGAEARYKKTVICKKVAKAKHVCQVCLLDLDYNLPVQVRDAAMGIAVDPLAPKSDVGREYALTNATEQGTLGIEYLQQQGGGGSGSGGQPLAIAGAGPSALAVSGGGSGGSDSLAPSLPASSTAAATPFGGPNPTLAALARKAPNFDRNRARICSFFAKGECKRGKSCPYRHELPTSAKDDPLARQDYKDRYFGVNDPVAARMAQRFVERASRAAAPPADQSITTLFVGNLPESATEGDLRAAFAKYGALSAVRFKQQRGGNEGGGGSGGVGGGGSNNGGGAAFVTFEDRPSAEGAARGLAGRLSVRGVPSKILWGRPAAPGGAAAGGGGGESGGGRQQQRQLQQQGGGRGGVLYPSMDPTRAGTALVAPVPPLGPPLAPPLNHQQQQRGSAGVVSARAVPAGMSEGGKRGGGGGGDGGRGKKPRT